MPRTSTPVRQAESAPDPLLGGTLALMSFYARTQHAGAARKIARNLALLSQHPQLSAPLQTICKRLFGDWVRAAGVAPAACPATTDVHEEPALMQ
jgi:hypothetical protein